MTNSPESSFETKSNLTAAKTDKKPLYPEVNGRLVNFAFWLGIGFAVIAFFMQNVSGYF